MRAVMMERGRLGVDDLPIPEPGPGEVLVKIGASGVNHLDHDLREGVSGFGVTLPHVMGVEGVGDDAVDVTDADGLVHAGHPGLAVETIG